MSRAPTAAFLALAALTGCTRDDTVYPSLAPRPVERLGFEEPDPPAPQPVVPDQELDLEVAAVDVRLNKAAADFGRAADAAQAAAGRARGAPAGAESWLDAQTALSALDALRAELSEIVSDLDRLTIDRAVTLAPAYPSLDAARTRARAELARQEATIRRIESTLAPA